MEIDFRVSSVIPRTRTFLIGIKRHLERISCGIPAESGPIELRREARNPQIHA